MRIQTNVESLNAYRNLNNTNKSMSQSMERLSSGFRINRAADDAAGLAISEKMRGQVRGLDQSVRNAQDATSMIQTAEGALNESHEILQRMRELSVQASNDTLTESDRGEIQEEIDQLTAELDRIADTTEFNTQNLLDGNLSAEASVEGVVAFENDYDSAVAEGVTNNTEAVFNGGASGGGTDNQINIDTAGNFSSAYASGGTATIDVGYNTDGDLTVDLAATGGNGTFTAADTVEADEDGNFTYDNHGVSFTLSADEYEQLTQDVDAGDTAVSITASDQAASGDDLSDVSLTSDWEGISGVGSGTNPTVSGLNIDPDADNIAANARSVEVAISDTGGTATVSILDADGNTLNEDVFTDASGNAFSSGSLSYDNHGVSFDLSVEDADAGTFAKEFDTGKVGTEDNSSVFHIGANEDQNIKVAIGDMSSEALEIGDIDVTTQATADEAITTINNAIEEVSRQRSELGAVQNRLDHTVANLEVASENLQAAESRIRDVDMALEMTNFSKQQILEQAGTAMLAQSNQAPQSVLQLLG